MSNVLKELDKIRNGFLNENESPIDDSDDILAETALDIILNESSTDSETDIVTLLNEVSSNAKNQDKETAKKLNTKLRGVLKKEAEDDFDPKKALSKLKIVNATMRNHTLGVLLVIFLDPLLGLIIYYFYSAYKVRNLTPALSREYYKEAKEFKANLDKAIKQAKVEGRNKDISRLQRYGKKLDRYLEAWQIDK